MIRRREHWILQHSETTLCRLSRCWYIQLRTHRSPVPLNCRYKKNQVNFCSSKHQLRIWPATLKGSNVCWQLKRRQPTKLARPANVIIISIFIQFPNGKEPRYFGFFLREQLIMWAKSHDREIIFFPAFDGSCMEYCQCFLEIKRTDNMWKRSILEIPSSRIIFLERNNCNHCFRYIFVCVQMIMWAKQRRKLQFRFFHFRTVPDFNRRFAPGLNPLQWAG